MRRLMRVSLGILAVSAVTSEARAQFGYGYYPSGYGSYGWGGWGGESPQGDYARGLGYYATGLGNLEKADAAARAVDTESVMRWNQFMYASQIQANRNERLRLRERMIREVTASDALNKREAESPSDSDIANGNALNFALDQVTNPKVPSSTLRTATAKVPGTLIRAVPFVNAAEAVSISLDQLTAENGWPVALRDPRFVDERMAYSAAVDRALKETQEGAVSAQTVGRSRGRPRAWP